MTKHLFSGISKSRIRNLLHSVYLVNLGIPATKPWERDSLVHHLQDSLNNESAMRSLGDQFVTDESARALFDSYCHAADSKSESRLETIIQSVADFVTGANPKGLGA